MKIKAKMNGQDVKVTHYDLGLIEVKDKNGVSFQGYKSVFVFKIHSIIDKDLVELNSNSLSFRLVEDMTTLERFGITEVEVDE